MSTSKTWPGGATSATPTAYSIPAAGELNWATLSDFLIALADSAQSTSFQKFAVRKALTTPVTVSASTDCIVDTDLTAPGAVVVNLPAGANKQVFIIVDGKGDAATNNITINRAGSDTIAGSTSLVLTTNREVVMLVFNSSDTDWKIAYRCNGQTPFTNPMTTIGDTIYGNTSGVPARVAAGTAQNWYLSGGAGSPTWSNTTTTGKFIDGSADEVQWHVQGHSTQTNFIELIEKSDGTDLRTVDNSGNESLLGGLKVTNSDGNQTSLTYFEQTSFTVDFNNAINTTTVTVKAIRVQNLVTLEIPSFSGTTTSTAAIITNSAIAARFRPAIESRQIASVQNGGAQNTPGAIYFKTTGNIEIYTTMQGNGFPTLTANCGLGGGGGSTQSWSYFV